MTTNVQVLVLNKQWKPVGLADVERTMGLLCTGAARALDRHFQTFDFDSWSDLAAEYGDDVVRTPNRTIKIPRVVVLQVYDRLPRTRIRFSRNNVYLRDGFTCAYCGVRFPRSKLNLDHIIPKSRGGRTSWDNIVCTCIPCNTSKANRTPQEAGMTLKFQPKKPTWTSLSAAHARSPDRVPYAEWLPFIDPVDASYWNTEIESD